MCLLTLQLAVGSVCLPALSQEAPTEPVVNNLDLGSADRNVAASAVLQPSAQATISVGGAAVTYSSHDMITAAEMVAVRQVLATGTQFLQLNDQGVATGGGLHLHYYSGLNNLVIPTGVSASQNAAVMQSLNLTGNLTNSGTLNIFSSNSAITSSSVNAVNILNNAGALITSSLANLNLNAVNNIVNAGTIYSAGNLNMTAGGSITNTAVMQAVNAMSLSSGAGNIVNSGLISSLTSNISVNTQTISNLLISNTGGIMQALNGSINVRDALYSAKSNTNLVGGDWLSQQLNVHSGNGIVDIGVEKLTGKLNVYAGEVHVQVATDNLHLGDMIIIGDPTYYNTLGDVTLGGSLVFSGQALAIIARNNIVTTSGVGSIDTSSATGAGGTIYMAAGVAFTSTGPASGSNDTSSTLTITGRSAEGGKIDLDTGNAITGLTSRGATSSGSGNGGTIQLLAFKGTNSDSGTIKLPSAVTITSGGGGSGTNGAVQMLAEATSGSGINIGSINTTGGTGTTGQITLITDGSGSVSFPMTIFNGSPGNFGTVSNLGTSLASMSTGALTGGNINLTSGGDLFVNGNLTVQNATSGAAGQLTIRTNSSSTFTIGPGASGTGINGTVSVTAGAVGAGGNISITNYGTGGITLSNPANLITTVTSGAGPTISLLARQGSLSIGTGTISTSGVTSGAANSLTLQGTTINVTGGGTLTLTANSIGTGNGGTVNISATAPGSTLTFDNVAGGIIISATGGATSGTGGNVTASAGGNLSYNASITIAPNATNATGGSVSLTAGANGSGALTALNGLSVNGNGTAAAGTIVLQANSSTALTIGSNLTASGGGGGGTIKVGNFGTGGITFSISNALTATATGSSGAAGTITVDAGTLGTVNVTSAGTWSANASTNGGATGAGGSITIRAGTFTNSSGSALTLTANGAQSNSTSIGGTITITTYSSTSDLSIDNTAGSISLSAQPGTSSFAAGGIVSIYAGRNLTVDPAFLVTTNNGNEVTGPILTLAAGTSGSGNLYVDGNLNVSPFSCSCGSNGGTINLFSNSTTSFNVSASATTNGVKGTLTSNAGNIGSSAGTINIINYGSGGVNIEDPANIILGGNNAGGGGTLKIEAPVGTLSFQQGGTLAVNGNVGSVANGGTVTLLGRYITVSGGTALTISTSAESTGNGGSVSITTLAADSDFTVGSSNGQFIINSNAAGTGARNGGTVTISTGRNLTINTGQLTATASGNGTGAALTLTAGTAGSGNLFITGNIAAQGIGSGAGGTIILNSNSSTVFNMAAGASTNGITGQIQAQGGSGGGGTIRIRNFGTGGITVDTAGNLVTSPTSGAGGTVELNAGSGVLTFNNSTALQVIGVTSGAGGTATLIASSFSWPSGLTIQAIGSNSGAGGTITVVSTSPTADISIDTGALTLQAASGSAGGAGGIVSVSSGRNLTVNTSALVTMPLGTNGNGSQISLSAGTAGTGLLYINNAIDVSGNGTGNGGSLTLSARSSSAFIVGTSATTLGVDGTITAQDGATGSGTCLGGTISITNLGSGGISLDAAANLSVNRTTGSARGGTITLNAGSGVLTIPSGTLSANGTGTSSNGFQGGTITLTASSLSISGGALTVQANANSAGSSPGGTISITTTSSTYDIAVGSGSGQLIVQAIASNCSGCSGIATGGTAILSSGRHLTVDPGSININPTQSGSGEAGTMTLTAGTTGFGNLFISGTLNVNGNNAGGGGIVTLTSNSPTTFTIGSGASTNGVNGNINAQSGSVGGNFWGGGTINIINNGTGGITLNSTSVLSVAVNGSNGYGGNISLNAGSGTLTIPTGTISTNAVGSSFGNPGPTITLTANLISITGGALTLTANSGTDGFGGTITITQTSIAADLTVGTGSGQLILSATGNGSNGRGGTVTLSSGRNLTIDPSQITANPLSTTQRGAIYSFTAGATASQGNLFISGNLVADGGSTTGNGGSITLVSKSTSAFNVAVGATTNGVNGILAARNNGNSTTGGTISITNNGSGGITLGLANNLGVNNSGTNSNGGTITLNAGSGVLTIPSGTLSVNGQGTSSNGGTLTITASSLSISGGALTLSANATSSGTGGTVSVTTTSGSYDITVGTASGNIIVSATGSALGSLGGSSGAATISSGRHLTINPSSLTTQSLGASSSITGPTLNLTAGTAGSGNVFVNGDLSVTSGSYIAGSGGTVNITMNSSTVFTVGSGATTNGVNGSIYASGGTTGGGGTISIVNNGNGGVTINSAANLSLNGVIQGKGGSLSLNAGSGTLTLPSGIYVLSGTGSATNGGNFTINAATLTLSGASALTVLANGATTGNGGSISITAGGNWTVGTGIGELNLTANGGLGFAASGNAGTISITSTSGNLTVTPSAMISQALGSSGNGATFNLSAAGNLFINGSLYAVGRGTGNGGSITLSSNSSTLFNITSGATTNGVNGVLVVTAGTTSGNGGTISASNAGSGGLTLGNINNVFNRPSYGGGAGGSLVLSATSGPMSIPTGTYSADASGTSAANGGTVTFIGTPISISGGTALTFSANGRVTGNGGSVTMISGGPAVNDLTVGSGNISISAQSGSTGGNGGTVLVSAARHLVVDPAYVIAGPSGTSGNGATVTLIAGNGGSGNLQVNGSFSVNGKGTGNGGSITLSSASAAALTTGSNTGFNYVNGTLSARGGGTSGNSGSISLTNLSTGGITIGALSNISLAPTSGNGGNLTLSSGSGTLTIPTGTLSVNGVGTNANGGTVTLSAGTISVTGGALAITADASGIGNGGTVSVTSSGSTSDLVIGNGSGQINISAAGGSAGSTAGNGGTAVLSSGRHLTINNTFDPNVGPQGANGNGGNLTLVAGTGGSGNLVVTGSLTDSQGVGTGNGGTVSITYRDATNSFVIGSSVTNSGVTGIIYAGAPLNGTGGSITIANSASATLSISGAVGGQLLADSVYGSAGTITLSKAGQAVNVNLLVLEGKIVSTGTSISLQSQAHTGGGLLRPQNVTATAGNVIIYSELAPIALSSSATVSATDGDVTIQHSGTDPGTGAPYIRLGQNSTISASSTDPGEGRIYVVIGAIPPSPVAGSAPSNFSSNLSNGGQVFFGTNGITASTPTNTANVDGARVVFTTGSLNSTYIVLDGGVVLNSTGTPSVAILTSLDLTDSTVTSYIQTQQGLGNLGGTLIVSGGVAQPGSTLTIQPGNLSASLSSFNIPTGVVVTMDQFTGSNTITIDVTGSSFTNQATLTGTAAFGSGSGTIVVNSTIAGNALLINSAGVLSSSATLDISTNRSASIAGTITASTLNITTTANNGAISVTGSITGSSAVNLTTQGTGNVTSGVSSFVLSTNNPITITANDVAFSGSVNAGTGTVTLRPNGTQSMTFNGSGGTFSVLSTDLNAIVAGTLVLGSNTNTGNISLASNLTLPGSGTPGTTAGLYNLDIRSGGAGGTYSAGSASLNMRGQNLTINVASTVNTGSGGISGTSGTVAITGTGVTIGSAINLSGNGTINLTATGSSNIIQNGNLSTASGGQIALTTGSGSVSQSASITSGSLTLLSTSGSFSLSTTVSNLTANTSNGVNITNTGTLTVGPSGATNTGSTFSISNNDAITVAGAITATSISGITLTTTANDGSITVNADLTGGSTTLNTNGTGVVTSAGGTDIEANNGTLSITARNILLSGTLTGANDVMLLANAGVPVVIGGTSGTFNVTTTIINNVTANNLLIGYGSSQTLVAPVDISSANFNGFYLQPTGSYSANGQTLTIGGKLLSVQNLGSGTIDTGAVTGNGSSSITFNSALALTVSGAVTGGSMQFLNNSGNITFAAGVSGTSINVSGPGEIIQSSGTIAGTSLTLNATNGIGLLSPIQTAVNSINISTGSSASAFVTDAGTLQITSANVGNSLQVTTTGASANITVSGAATTTNGLFQLIANGSITVSQAISGNTLSLQTSSGSNGAITLNHNVTGTNGVTITTDGSGNVTNSASRAITATNSAITITANDVSFSGTVNSGTSGTVTLQPNGAKSIAVGGGAATFTVSATDLAAITTGTLTVGTTSQAGGFTVGGNLNVSGAGPAGAYNLVFNNGGNYTAAGRIITLGTKTLTVNALGTVNTGTVTGGNTTVLITSGTGTTVSNPVTVTGGTVTLNTTNNGSILVTANVGGGSITNLDVHGSGNIDLAGSGYNVSGTTVNLSADNGTIGTSGGGVPTIAGTLTVNTSGGALVTNTGDVTLGTSNVGGTLQIITAGAGSDIFTSGTVSANAFLILTAVGSVSTSNPISAGDELRITANDISFGASVTATTLAWLQPTANQSISLGGTGGTFSVLTSDLAQMNTPRVIIGNNTSTGGITVTADINASGHSYDILQLENAGSFSAAGTTITLGAGQLISATITGTVDTGSISLTNAEVAFSVGSTITISGNITGADSTVGLAAQGNGSVVVSGNVGGTNTEVYLSAAGSGTITRTGNFTVSGSVVELTGTNGDIGQPLTPLQVDAVTLSANTNGSIYINEANSVNLNSSSAGGTFTLNTASNGSIVIINDSSAATMNLTANGLGTITRSGLFTLTATNLNLFSTDGDIGQALTPLFVSAGSVTANTNGSVYINEANAVTLGASTIGGTLTLNTASNGAITIGANSSATTMNLTANGSGTITRSGAFTLTGTTINLASTDGDIGQSGTPILTTAGTLTAITNGSAYLSETNAVTLGASTIGGTLTVNTASNGGITISANSSAGTMNLIADGTGTITRSGAFTLTATTLNLASTDGDIGQVLMPLLTTAGTLTASTNGSVYINETNAVTLGASTVGGTFTILTGANGGIIVGANSSASTMNLTTNGAGTITRSGAFTLTGTNLNLASTNGDIGQSGTPLLVTAGTVTANTTGSVYLNETNSVNLGASTIGGTLILNTASNGSIVVTADSSAGTMNLVAAGSGTITRSGNFTLTAPTMSLSSTSGDLGVFGTSLLTNSTSITASTSGSIYLTETGSVNISSFTVGAAATLGLSTSSNGSINIDSNFSAGSIFLDADGAGTITRSGSFTMTSTILTLNSDTGNIGQSGTPVLTDAPIVIASTGGSIYLRNTTDLATSGFTFGASGTLDLTTTTGTITVDSNVVADTIRLSAGGSGEINRTGNVTLTANAVTLQTSSGNIGDTGNELQTAAGTLTVSSGGSALINELDSVNLAASTISGTLALQTTSSDGAITITGNVGATSMLLATDGTGNIERSGNFTLTAGVVNLGSDNGNFGTSLAPLQLNAGSTTIQTAGSALLSETNSIILGFTSVGGTLELTTGAGGTITLADTISATSMTLTAGGSGSIVDGGSGSLSASVINLASTTGDIGSSGDPLTVSANVLTANTGGSIYINEANSVTLGFTNAGGTLQLTTSANGNIAIADQVSATTMTLTANGLGTITRTGSQTMSATTMTLNSTLGDIGQPGTPLLTAAGTLTTNTAGGVYVTNANSLTLANSTVGGNLVLTTNGTLTSSTVNSGGNVAITANALDNSGTISATNVNGTVSVTSGAGLGLTVGGGGTMSGAGGITLTASASTMQFTGNQTFTDDVVINGTGANGDVLADVGTAINSTANMTINSAALVTNPSAFSAAGTLVINDPTPVPPTPPAPSPSEESSPTLIALVADASSTTSQSFVTRNDPIVISTDQNQGIAGNSLSQALLGNLTNGLTSVIFGSTPSAPSSTIANSNSLSNNSGTLGAGSAGSTGNIAGPVVTSDVDLAPFADLLPGGSTSVSGNIVSKSPDGTPKELTAQPGTLVPAPQNSKSEPANPMSSLGEVFKVGETRSNLVMFTMANQVFSGFIGGNSDTTVSGTPGTIFSTDKNTVVLHTGRMITDNGKQGMTVFTQQAAVMIGADSAAVVDVHPGAPTRVMAVGGHGSASTTVRTRDGLVIPLAAGQEVIIGQTDLSDEDLIPVDGMDREFVSGGIQVSSRKVAKDNFSLDEFMDKEIMVAGVPVRLGGSNNKRLHGKISAAAKRQAHGSRVADNYNKKKKGLGDNEEDKTPTITTKQPVKDNVVTQANEPARVLAEKETQFSLTTPGHMSLIKGSLFMHNSDAAVVDTPMGQVHGAKGSMFKVTSQEGTVRTQAMSGPDDVFVVAGKRLIPLNCGKEVFITDHKPTQSETVPADGVGRRGMSAFALDGKLSAVVGDFSMVTLLNSTNFLNPLKNPSSQSDHQLHEQIVKAAAVIQHVLGNRGRYYIAPKERASNPIPDWVIKTTGEKPDKLPLLKALLDPAEKIN